MVTGISGKIGSLRSWRPAARWAGISLAVGVAVSVPLVWSVRQARLTNEALARAIAAEGAAARAQTGVDRSRAMEEAELKVKRDGQIVRAKRKPSKQDAERTRQLSAEIEGLSAMQEKIEQDLYQLRQKAAHDSKNPRPSYPLP